MKMIFISLFLIGFSLQAADSTFVGNGGNAGDIELHVSKAILEKTLKTISNDQLSESNLCRCTGNYAQYPACKSLEKLTDEQVNFCAKFIKERSSVLSQLLEKSEVTIQWTEEALRVKENNANLPVDAVTIYSNKAIMINKENYLRLESNERNFLLGHELFHLTTYENNPVSDEQKIGPFSSNTGGRSLLNAVGAALVMYSLQNKIAEQHDSDLNRSRQSKKFWISLEYSQFESKEDLGTLYIPSTYSGGVLSFQYLLDEHVFVGLYGSSFEAKDTFIGTINGKDTIKTLGLGAQYRFFPFSNLFSFEGQSFGTVGFRYEFLNSQFELTENSLSIEDKVTTNYLTLDTHYYIPLQRGFWLQAGLCYNQPNYKYSDNVDAKFSKGRLFTNIGVSYAF
jgi:hypothetical protein